MTRSCTGCWVGPPLCSVAIHSPVRGRVCSLVVGVEAPRSGSRLRCEVGGMGVLPLWREPLHIPPQVPSTQRCAILWCCLPPIVCIHKFHCYWPSPPALSPLWMTIGWAVSPAPGMSVPPEPCPTLSTLIAGVLCWTHAPPSMHRWGFCCGPLPCPVCDNSSGYLTPGPLGCPSTAKPSPLLGSICWSLTFST